MTILYYTGIGGLPMPEKQEDKNGETDSGLCSLCTCGNCRVHHVIRAVRHQGNKAVLPTWQCQEGEATGMSRNGRRGETQQVAVQRTYENIGDPRSCQASSGELRKNKEK